MTTRVSAIVAACLIAIVAGCGGGGLVKVAGNVSFQGQPVDNGEIIFTTSDDKQSVAAPIVNGRYEVQLSRGTHKVRISAYREVPGKVDRSNPGQETPVVEMYIPPQYNSKSTLEKQIDGSTDQLDFPLS